uniref:Uncharacterized protein n=1 Tax=Moniliophthora roreri TaxID=221103 RepID=A0A0W0FT21_MONRR
MASQDHPKTPAKPTGNTLFSTPGNMGSAGRSQDMESFNTDIVAPILSHDLNLSQTFRLEEFLIAKLEEIRKPGVIIGGKDLLDEAFQVVARYANGEEGGTDIITMKENLREYLTKAKNMDHLYSPPIMDLKPFKAVRKQPSSLQIVTS